METALGLTLVHESIPNFQGQSRIPIVGDIENLEEDIIELERRGKGRVKLQ